MPRQRRADHDDVGAVAELLRLLGDATRIRILGLLQDGELNVSAMCDRLNLAQPTVSHHLGLLRSSGLVLTRRSGKQVYYELNDDLLTSSRNGALTLDAGSVRVQIQSPAAALGA